MSASPCRSVDHADRMPDGNQFKGSATEAPCFNARLCLAFGQSERKDHVDGRWWDRSLRARELGEEVVAPAQDEEFVMSHSDNVQATGFVEHLKLPHYVDFQSETRPAAQIAPGVFRSRGCFARLCGRPAE